MRYTKDPANKEVRDAAMKDVMWNVGNRKNPVTEYIADAIARRVTMDEAEYSVEATSQQALHILELEKRDTAESVVREGDDEQDYVHCPACNEIVGIMEDYPELENFCSHCGKKIKW